MVRCSWGVGPSPFLFCHKLQNGFSRFRNTNTRTQVQIHSNSIHKTFDKNLQYPLRLCCQPSRRFLGLTERKHNFKPRQLANVAFLSLCFCDNVQQPKVPQLIISLCPSLCPLPPSSLRQCNVIATKSSFLHLSILVYVLLNICRFTENGRV